MTTDIRPATLADLPAVRDLLAETWHAIYDAIHGAAEVAEISGRWHAIDVLERQLATPNATFLVATREAACIATSLALPQAIDLVVLSRLYVHPTAQGTGLGRRLLAATLAPYAANVVVRLEVDPLNGNAIRFYERHGFLRIGEVRNSGNPSRLEALTYERKPWSSTSGNTHVHPQ